MAPGESWKEEEETISMGFVFLPTKDPDADDGRCHPLQLSEADDLKIQRSRARVSTALWEGIENEKSVCAC